MKVPFNVYDFFAYLAAGFVIVASLDVAFGSSWILRGGLTTGEWGVVLVAAYVSGHAVAHVSAFLLEGVLVRRVLGPPSDLLMGERTARWKAVFFPGYCRPLPESTRGRVRARATAADLAASGESLFLHAFGIVAAEKEQMERLDAFRNLYGFARNMCVAAAMAAVILLGAPGLPRDGRSVPGWVVPALTGASVLLFYRYLKFFRQYTYQLLVVFAARKEPET